LKILKIWYERRETEEKFLEEGKKKRRRTFGKGTKRR
jgi:hypothetical protein